MPAPRESDRVPRSKYEYHEADRAALEARTLRDVAVSKRRLKLKQASAALNRVRAMRVSL